MKRRFLRFGFYCVYYCVSRVFLGLERLICWKEFRFWIDTTPKGIFKGVSFENYTAHIHTQGFFSALFSCYVTGTNLRILDFGCGMAKLAPVCQYWVKENGKYLGVDTDVKAIEQCRKTYGILKNCEFYLTADQNAFYRNPDVVKKETDHVDWPVGDSTQHLVIANSVFTHLQEGEARKYMRKIHAVLAPGGIAMISFHIVRDYVNPNPTFNFIHPLTPGWFTSTPNCPETAIGVELATVHDLIREKFTILNWLEGHSTGGKSVYFQDLFVLKKT